MEQFDVVVVGGGAAALSAALVLSRLRVSTLVIDGGLPRNRFSHSMHGVLSRDGMSPADYLEAGRREIAGYGTPIRAGQVTRVSGELGAFSVETEQGIVTAGRVVVATGLRDELPALAGLSELWGSRVFHCPFCHGWEVRDRHIAILVWHPLSLHQAYMLRRLTDRMDVIPFGISIDAEDVEKLARQGMEVRELRPVGVSAADDGGVMIHAHDGKRVHYDAFFAGGRPVPNDELLRELGCQLSENANPLGDHFIAVNAMGETSVTGVYAAGNVVDATAQVITATAAGSAVAVGIVQALTRG